MARATNRELAHRRRSPRGAAPLLEQGLLADYPSTHRSYFCTPLVCLGAEADAQILVKYRAWALPLPPEPLGAEAHCQAQALAALMYVDQQLGTTHAQRFLDSGSWRRWLGPNASRRTTECSPNASLAEIQEASGSTYCSPAAATPESARC
jgi:hypothetical protein